MKKIVAALALVLGMSTCAFSAQKAIHVMQPAYRDMKFYVYKPVNVPRDFYVTFDGYLVYRDNKGVWNYGTVDDVFWNWILCSRRIAWLMKKS